MLSCITYTVPADSTNSRMREAYYFGEGIKLNNHNVIKKDLIRDCLLVYFYHLFFANRTKRFSNKQILSLKKMVEF